jgi:hypothetical protein
MTSNDCLFNIQTLNNKKYKLVTSHDALKDVTRFPVNENVLTGKDKIVVSRKINEQKKER